MINKKQHQWGTHEWATNNLNCISGCKNGCLYCYSEEMAIRFKQKTADNWKDEKVRAHDLNRQIKHYEKRVMYPSSHDIRPEHLTENMEFLKHILEAGNKVLIVSKPHLVCIKAICKEFEQYKKKILFRFTIGSADDTVLKFWEPNAPEFYERLNCLILAHGLGFGTSVSCEPMLDNNIDLVIEKCSPYVTETIWIGHVNHLLGIKGRGRLDFNGHNDPATIAKAKELIAWQSDENTLKLYERYKNDPMIRWKESIKKVIVRKGGENDE